MFAYGLKCNKHGCITGGALNNLDSSIATQGVVVVRFGNGNI